MDVCTNNLRNCRFGTVAAVLAVLLQLSVVSAQQPNAPVNPSPPMPQSAGKSEMLIGAGDLLQITVYGTDFDKQVRVGDTGEVSLPFVGAVKLAGLSIRDAEQRLARQLAQGGYFRDPQVSIIDREYATQGISVLGEVQKPGIYPLPGARTLFDAISAAGGVTPKAGDTVTITHRGQPDQPENLPLSFNAGIGERSNVHVFPGDTIVVSKAGIVYVVGDVKQPSGFVLEPSGLSVLQALALAHGANSTAALSSAKLIHRTEDGPRQTPIDLKRILESKDPDIKLQAEDVLFVPNSPGKTAARRSAEAALQTLTGVVIYRH